MQIFRRCKGIPDPEEKKEGEADDKEKADGKTAAEAADTEKAAKKTASEAADTETSGESNTESGQRNEAQEQTEEWHDKEKAPDKIEQDNGEGQGNQESAADTSGWTQVK